MQQQPGFDERWIQHQRRSSKTTQSWRCEYCVEKRIFMSPTDLWNHALSDHNDQLPRDEKELHRFHTKFVSDSALKRCVYSARQHPSVTAVRGKADKRR